jgi:hypothetical protein
LGRGHLDGDSVDERDEQRPLEYEQQRQEDEKGVADRVGAPAFGRWLASGGGW